MDTLELMATPENDRRVPGLVQQEEALRKQSVAKEWSKAERRQFRREEDVAKAELLKREAENFTQILIFKCADGWSKVYNHSGVILSQWLDERLGRKSYELNDDQGYANVKAEYGAVSIPPASLADLIQRLVRAGLSMVDDSRWVMEFDLGERIDHEDMIRMLHENELIIEQTNKLVMPWATIPRLRAAVKQLLELVHTRIHGQRDAVKFTFLADAERSVVMMNRIVIATSRGAMRLDACLKQMALLVEEVYEYVTTMADLKMITAKQYRELVEVTRRVDEEYKRELKRIVVAKSKEVDKKKGAE